MSTAATVERILERIGHRQPKLAIVLSTGLQAVDGDVEDPTIFAYAELPGFPKSAVAQPSRTSAAGQARRAQRRSSGKAMRTIIAPAGSMRCASPSRSRGGTRLRKVLLTAAAQSLRTELGPGRLALVTSHAMLGDPMVLSQGFGTRYPIDWHAAFDPLLTERLTAAIGARRSAARLRLLRLARRSGIARGPGSRRRHDRCLADPRSHHRPLAQHAKRRHRQHPRLGPRCGTRGISPDLARQRADFGAIHLRRILADYLKHGGAD